MKKVISFTLWGNHPDYNVGMIKNAQLAKKYFPNWEVWVYYRDIPQDTLDVLNEHSNVKMIDCNEEKLGALFWRYLPANDPEVECFISRDADSRLSYRESVAVDEWLKSDRTLHIIRDHPCHGIRMLAGMWGLKGDLDIRNLLYKYKVENNKDVDETPDMTIKRIELDQFFLWDVIYEMYKEDAFIHSGWRFFDDEKETHQIAVERKNYEFIGERWDWKENRNYNDSVMLKHSSDALY